MSETIRFRLNGKSVSLETDAQRKLLWVLRTDLEVTGTKYGCGEGLCGACTVIVDGKALRSCLTPLAAVQGKEVTTIEGLARDGKLHPLQEAFAEHGGFQCGYCTPGMIMNAYGVLLSNPHATQREILSGMEMNLCRCGAHQRIVAAIETAAGARGGDRD
jgi:aerobic-type carbon monoxide dehydrogenase small subunit (CoxS/CutS family)